MKRAISTAMVLCTALSGCSGESGNTQTAQDDPNQYWVTSDRLDRHTCPADECGVVGRLFFREGVKVLERSDGWARITQYYDASCRSGVSEYVDTGNAACEESNGISAGKFAEWVRMENLVSERPADPSEGATGLSRLIGGSDDFRKFEAAFVKAAQSLIDSGQCTEQDFIDIGGWVKSSNQANRPIYFTYCKNGTDRIYLNAETGEIYR